jgi:KaiC/GvpD/RAD55 family RecA-like ATPase
MGLERLGTGVARLDEILGGGIPEGHIVLVSGAAGTGKTILGLQYLCEGAHKGEKGVYIGHTEERESILNNMGGFEFFQKEFVDDGLIKIVDSNTFPDLDCLGEATSEGVSGILEEILGDKPSRVVIDSITSVCDALEQNKMSPRKFTYNLRGMLRGMGATTLLLSEVKPLLMEYSKHGVEEFISDGVIHFLDVLSDFKVKRSLTVMKMRGVDHTRENHAVVISSKGLDLQHLFKE